MVELAEIPEGGLRLANLIDSEGYDLGDGTPWKILRYTGLTGVNVRSGTSDIPRGDGAFGGQHYAGRRLLNIDLKTRGTPSEVQDHERDLRRYMVPVRSPRSGVAVEWRPIGETHARRRIAFARPLRCDVDYYRPVTGAEAGLTLELRDPRWRFAPQDYQGTPLTSDRVVTQDPAANFGATFQMELLATAGELRNIEVIVDHPSTGPILNEFKGLDLIGANGDKALLRFNRRISPDGLAPIVIQRPGSGSSSAYDTWTIRNEVVIPPGPDATTVSLNVTQSAGGGAGNWRLQFNSTEV